MTASRSPLPSLHQLSAADQPDQREHPASLKRKLPAARSHPGGGQSLLGLFLPEDSTATAG